MHIGGFELTVRRYAEIRTAVQYYSSSCDKLAVPKSL